MSTSPTRSHRLRVLHIVPDMGVGGLPRVVETLCRTTDPARFEVGVLTLNFAGELAEALAAAGYATHDLPRPGKGPDYGASRRVAALLRRERVDVVHTHNTQALMHGGLGALFAGVRTLIHTDHARPFPDALKYMVIERVLSTLAYKVVGVSEHTTDALHRYEWIPRAKLCTIPNGIEPGLFDGSRSREEVRAATRASLGIAADAEVLLIGARLEEQKGITYLLQAMPTILAARPNARLVIAGTGTLRSALEAEAQALGVSGQVQFLGVRLDMPALLVSADLFMLPSNWEGLPMIVLEALAAQCPIIATAVGGVPSAVRAGESGVLVPPRDPAALARAVIALLQDPRERARLATGGRAVFDAHFSAAAMARQYEALYTRQAR